MAEKDMEDAPTIITVTDIRPGDVLLCFRNDPTDENLKKIKEATNSKYTHASICIAAGKIAEAVDTGLQIDDIKAQLGYFDHIAVFSPLFGDVWTPRRLETLTSFINSAIATCPKFNWRGFRKFLENKEFHEGVIQEQLKAYFNGDYEPPPTEKMSYFCSEFVVACFISAGIITKEGSVLYKPSVYSPMDLGNDATFGLFKGFLVCKDNYKIPKDDDFYDERPIE